MLGFKPLQGSLAAAHVISCRFSYCVILQYMVNGKIHAVLVTKEDYIKDSFHKYLKEIFRYPGCTKGKFNAFVAFLLQSVSTQNIMMFPHQGWNATEEGAITFASEPTDLYIPHSLISPSVARRKLKAPEHSQQEIIERWKTFFSKNPSLMFMGYYRIASLFQYFLREAGLNIKQFLIVEPSQGMSKEQLTAALATGDTVNFPVPTLGAGEDTILRILKAKVSKRQLCCSLSNTFSEIFWDLKCSTTSHSEALSRQLTARTTVS